MRKLLLIGLLLASFWSFGQTTQNVRAWETTSSCCAYTVSITGFDNVYARKWYMIRFVNGVSGASTLSINGQSAQDLRKKESGTWVALDANDISNNEEIIVKHNGTFFECYLSEVSGGGGGGPTFGTQYEIPFVNSTSTDFDYSSDIFQWEQPKRVLKAGQNITNSGSIGSNGNSIIVGEDITLSADHSWDAIFGDQHNIGVSFNDNIVGGNQLVVTGGVIANSIFVGGPLSVSGTGAKSGSAIFGRSQTLNVATDGRDNFMAGSSNSITGTSTVNSASLGSNTNVSGRNSFGFGYRASGSESILASGINSFNFSTNTSAQTAGHGALADQSVILGGQNANIPSSSPRSVVLGGSAVKARSSDADQVYVPNLNINSTPIQNDTLSQILARDWTTGQIKFVDASALGGGGGSGTVTSVAQSFTGGLISVGGSPITTSGTLALTVAGTSGGIPYFSSSSTWASSGTLDANSLVIGGGAGSAPSTTTTGTGILTALGVNIGSAGSPILFNGAGGTPSSMVGTNIIGTASGLTAGTVTTNANLTGDVTSSGNVTSLSTAYVLDQVSVNTSGGTITLDFNSQKERSHYGSASFSAPKTIAFSNTTNAIAHNFLFEVTNVAAVLTMPSTVWMFDERWDGTDWTPLDVGEYLMGISKFGTEFKVTIYGPMSN